MTQCCHSPFFLFQSHPLGMVLSSDHVASVFICSPRKDFKFGGETFPEKDSFLIVLRTGTDWPVAFVKQSINHVG